MNKIERRMEIMHILNTQRLAKIDELAEIFSVSTRTIKFDLEALTCLYPIETIRGRYGGGVKLSEWYHPEQSHLNPEQIALLKRLAATLKDHDLVVMNSIISQFSQNCEVICGHPKD